jgi:16S rRNA (uracil1498-N3)-methyltransferase
MKVHRFYIGGLHDKRGPVELRQHIWVHDDHLLNQWLRVLRMRVNDELELFDDDATTKLYKIDKVEEQSVGLTLVTELEPTIPKKHIYLLWSLLKKDNNDLVLQKCTELGVRNFVPIISERTEKMGFDEARAQRIVIEAAEQCGRSDIPHIREPITLTEAIDEYKGKINLYVADKDVQEEPSQTEQPIGVIIGPEGGWTEQERVLFNSNKLKNLNLHDLTLRAETAAIAAVSRINNYA